jgi:hypothetical protein
VSGRGLDPLSADFIALSELRFASFSELARPLLGRGAEYGLVFTDQSQG